MGILLGKEYPWTSGKIFIAEESGLWGESHGHIFIEIVYFSGKGGYHCVKGKYYPIQKGDVFLIPPKTEHFYVNDVAFPDSSGVEVINLIFREDIFTVPDGETNYVNGLISYYADDSYKLELDSLDCLYCSDIDFLIRDLMTEIKSEQENKSVGYQIVVEAKLKTLIALMVRRYLSGSNERAILSHKGIALHIASMIDHSYREPPKTEELAVKFGFSESSIRRIFKEEMGVSIGKYIQQVRIKAACRYLLEHNLSVEVIMDKIGMNDKKQFYELFKREVGMTPKEYKNLGGLN